MVRLSSTPARGAALASVILGACGPANLLEAEAVVVEHCGVEGPARVLSLADDEMVALHHGSVVRDGSRWLVAITSLDRPYDGSVSAGREHGIGSRVVSVDECGQQPPQLIAEGIDRVFASHGGGLPWVGCSSESGDMYIIDPDGQLEPSWLGIVEHCWFRSTSDSLWMRGRAAPDAPDALTVVTAASGGSVSVRRMQLDMAPVFSSFAVDEQRGWVVTRERQLIELSLEPGDMTVLAEDVGQVVLAPDPRFLMWGSEGDTLALGPWTIYDRQTHEQIAVEVGGQFDVRVHGTRYSTVFEASQGAGESEYAVMRFPSLETTTFRGRWTTIAENGPGDIVLHEGDGRRLFVLPAGVAEPELLYDGTVVDMRVDDDAVWAWEYEPLSIGSLQEIETTLMRIPIRGGEPEVVVDGVFQPLGLDDGRWLAVRGWDGDGIGDLVVVDPNAASPQRIDRDVSVWFSRHTSAALAYPGEDIRPSDDPILYSVYDGGERNGLWTTVLAPAP